MEKHIRGLDGDLDLSFSSRHETKVSLGRQRRIEGHRTKRRGVAKDSNSAGGRLGLRCLAVVGDEGDCLHWCSCIQRESARRSGVEELVAEDPA